MADLTKKVALITGSSRGIGRATAIALAQAGADIVLNYRSRETDARRVQDEIQSFGRKCIAVQADVSRQADVHLLITNAKSLTGTIDVLINNAGIARSQPFEAITEEDWNEVQDFNLKSCFLVTQAVLPGMRERRWGRIINISSVAAQVGGVVGPHYAASKAGMHGLTHYYASKLAREGITVNAVAPALIDTEMVRANPNATPDHIPVGRFGLPAEVGIVVVMLALNAYITGQTINVNGGWYLT